MSYDITYMQDLKNDTNDLFIKQKWTHRKQINVPKGKMVGEGYIWD